MENQIKSKRLHITLWVVQVILALAFGMVGIMKMYKPADQLIEMGMTFVKHFELSTIRFIGIAEILGAIEMCIRDRIWSHHILLPRFLIYVYYPLLTLLDKQRGNLLLPMWHFSLFACL